MNAGEDDLDSEDEEAVQTFWNQRRKARINKIAHFC